MLVFNPKKGGVQEGQSTTQVLGRVYAHSTRKGDARPLGHTMAHCVLHKWQNAHGTLTYACTCVSLSILTVNEPGKYRQVELSVPHTARQLKVHSGLAPTVTIEMIFARANEKRCDWDFSTNFGRLQSYKR